MKNPLRLGALFAILILGPSAARAIEVLHIGNADSTDYSSFINTKYPGSTWVHKPSALTGNDTIGGDLDRVADFVVVGTHGGTAITVRSYLQSFDLIIIGNGITSGNFVDSANGADWAGLTKPVLVHASLAARALGGRIGLFSGDNNITTIFGGASDTVKVSTTTLGNAIFAGVTTATDLYSGSQTETINTTATLGGGEIISNVTTGTTASRGITFWNAGTTNGFGLAQAAKRAFMPLRNQTDSSSQLTVDGKIVLGNLIGQLLLTAPPVFLPPTGLTATSSGVSHVSLSWTTAAGTVSYNVKRSTVNGGPYTTISTAGAITGTTYLDTDPALVNDTTYYYVVSGVNSTPTESANSAQASAIPAAVILPGINILFVANSDAATFKTFATGGEFSNNTWTQKATGTGGGTNQVGGDLDRLTDFTGLNGGTGISVRDYMQRFDLIIIGIPTTSSNFIDGQNGAAWASINKPLLFSAAVAARALNGRTGHFSGDNFITFTLDPLTPVDSARVSTSALSDAILAGVGDVTNLYVLSQTDTINGAVPVPNAYGNGEQITSITDGIVSHRGVVFWPAGATLPVVPPSGLTVASNRAYLPLKGNLDDLTADGKKIMANLIKQLRVVQTVPPALLTIPTDLVAALNGTSVDLTWSESIGAATYTIKRSTAQGTGYGAISTGMVTGTTYTDTSAAPGTTYYYVVSAVSNTLAASANSNEATVTLPAAANDYNTWSSSFGLENPWLGVNPALNGESSADPDGDGLTNFQEYAFGLVPNSGSFISPIAAQLNKASGKFKYTRRAISLPVPPLTYTVKTTTTLSGWVTDGGATQVVTGTVGEVETVEVTLSSALLSNPKLFARVEAQ